jgi:hypothetical protein
VGESIREWLALISHRWPFIHPGTVEGLQLRWWVYYVRAAMAYRDAIEDARRGAERGTRGDR